MSATPTRLLPAETSPRRAARSGGTFAHIQALDGLRGVAVAAVVVYHFAPEVAPGGFLGVDLFFVLSGFLITSLLVLEWERAGKIALRAFWARRARRLLPALFLVLAVVMLHDLLWSSHAEAHRTAVDGLYSAFYLANWHFVFSDQSYIQQFLVTTPSPLRHMWSLAIEEQFYLIWPLVIVGIGALAARKVESLRFRFRRSVITTALVVGAASLAWMAIKYTPGSDPSRVYYGTDTRAYMVLSGSALAAATARVGARPRSSLLFRRVAFLVGFSSAAALVIAFLTVHDTSDRLYGGGYGLLAVLMVAAVWACSRSQGTAFAKLLSWRPLVGLGLISYGVYLWHWPIGIWLSPEGTGLDGAALFALRSAATLAVALLSYRLLELPIRRGALTRLPLRARAAASGLAAASVVALLVVSVVRLPAVDAPPQVAVSTKLTSAATAAYTSAPRCDVTTPQPALDLSRHLLVQLEGNSIAGEIRTCLGTILDQRNADLEGVNPPGFLLCHEIPAIAKQVKDPKTRPDAAVLFVFVAYDGRCGQPWHWPVDKLVSIWKRAGVHVFLVPSVPFLQGTEEASHLSGGPLEEVVYYQQLAARDPKHITLLDAGRYIRDANGNYLWRMPCSSSSEPGCDPDGTVGVRWVDGFHFCTDPDFAAHGCKGSDHQAGERRAAASVASGLLPRLLKLAGASR